MRIARFFWVPLLLTIFLGCQNTDQTPKTNAEESFPIPQDKAFSNTTGKQGGKLILSLASNPDTFNVNLSNSSTTTDMLASNVYEGLTDLNVNTFEDIPLLAKSFEVSPDGLTYTYTLREGVRWSDGHPFTADDVLFTFEVVYDPNLPAHAVELLRQKDGSLPKIKKVGDNQIQFELNAINVLFKGAVGSIYIIPKHIWEDTYRSGGFASAMSLNDDPKKMVSTGPYMVDSFTSDQRVVLKRNPYYYMFDKNDTRLPYFDKLFYLIVPDLQSRLIKFQNGETDLLDIKPVDVDLLKRDEKTGGYTVYDSGPSYNTVYLMFNQNTRVNAQGKPYVEPKKLKLFSDKRFKQAVSYALDRNSFVNTAYQGRGLAIYGYVSPANKIWFNPNIKTYPFDLEKAKTLLSEIGLKDSNNDGWLEYADGSKIEITVLTNANNPARVQMGNLLTNDLKKIGIQAVLQAIPFNTLLDSLDKNFDYDAVIMGWGSAVPPDPAMSKSTILSSGDNHTWNPAQKTPATEWEARMDALLFQNQSSLDHEERVKTWNEIQSIWSEELPQIMMVVENVHLVGRNWLGNLKPQSLRPYFNSLKEIYDKRLE